MEKLVPKSLNPEQSIAEDRIEAAVKQLEADKLPKTIVNVSRYSGLRHDKLLRHFKVSNIKDRLGIRTHQEQLALEHRAATDAIRKKRRDSR